MSDGEFAGKVALVTGAAGGMGRATALAFAAAGAQVVVADIADEGGKQTVELIREAGGEAVFAHTDVSRAADVEAAVALAVDDLRRARLRGQLPRRSRPRRARSPTPRRPNSTGWSR